MFIDDVFEKKIDMLDAHVSQFYEWLPWTQGQLSQVPKDREEREEVAGGAPHGGEKTTT
ncbi:MAG: hypothetical protein WA628_26945 [Terriglobales bacterium]